MQGRIMILRRITEHVRTQNWFAVCIDFVIVVVGVYIGIQVANWNAERLEAGRGDLFAERLIVDLRIENQNWNMLINYLRDVQFNAVRALEILEGTADASDEQLLIHAYRATQYITFARSRATYEELTSTGSLGLIKDQDLRDAAAEFYTWPGIEMAIDEGVSSDYRRLFRRALAVQAQDALSQACGDRFSFSGNLGSTPLVQINYDCTTGLTAMQIAEQVGALRDHPETLPTLRLRAMDVRTSISILTDTALTMSKKLKPYVGEQL
jgi:hypothetical protein